MALFNLETIKARLRRNATVTSAEVLILIRDLDNRLQELENGAKARLEEPKASGRGPSKLPKKKVSAD